MRHSFVTEVKKMMKKDKNIFFLTGDLGFNALEPIQEAFPDRFINVGIAEQNMIGIAAGLALTGKKVIAYSIASFMSMRGFEQIRNDICYHNLDVKLFGTGGGFNYPSHGVTHHTIEDIAIMRALPNMQIFNPGYAWEASGATVTAISLTGPTYMRLGKSPDEDYSQPDWEFALGKGFEVKKGKDVVLISTGNLLDVALETANKLEKETKKKVSVISMPTIKPIDKKLISKKLKTAKAIFTIEEHSVIGGLGGEVSEFIMTQRDRPKVFWSFGIQDKFVKDVGDRDYLLKKVGLDSDSMTKRMINLMKK